MRSLAACLLLLAAAAAQAADPVVENIQFAQRHDGSMLVNIVYDVADADGDTLAVTLLASDDGGATWLFPVRTVSGDVGPGVVPGKGKMIVWDLGADGAGCEGGDFRLQIAASDAGVDLAAHSPAHVAIMEWELVDWSLPGQFERYARGDLVMLQTGQMWGHPENEPLRVVDNLKAHNPAAVVLGYAQAKSVRLSWSRPDAWPYHRAMYDRTRPYWAWTTEGDTVQDHPGNVVLNILEPDCRAAILGTMAEFRRSSPNRLDGIFWDFFGLTLWIHPQVEFDGDPDLDGDGIGHWDDQDEKVAFRAAQDAMVTAARDSLGEDFILLLNGSRARVDSVFAAKGDGISYELFPTLYPFSEPEMASALDPDFPYSLFNTRRWPSTSNGGPYIVLEHFGTAGYYDDQGIWTELVYGDVHRTAALLTGAYAAWTPDDVHSYAWPEVDVSLGPPLGPAVIEGGLYSRDFRYGRLEMEMGTGRHPNPYSYRIWLNGALAVELDVPRHFP